MLVHLDFESTGLNVYTAQLIEIALVACEADDVTKVHSTWTTLVKPAVKIPEIVQEKVHITDRMVEGAPTADVALQRMFEWLKDLPSDSISLSAYNGIGYDCRLLLAEMERHKMSPLLFTAAGVTYFVDPFCYVKSDVDVSLLAHNKHGRCLRSLSKVYSAMFDGEEFDNAHRALEDTKALHRLCSHEVFKDMCCTENSSYCMDQKSYFAKVSQQKKKYQLKNNSSKKKKKMKGSLLPVLRKRKKPSDDEDTDPTPHSTPLPQQINAKWHAKSMGKRPVDTTKNLKPKL